MPFSPINMYTKALSKEFFCCCFSLIMNQMNTKAVEKIEIKTSMFSHNHTVDPDLSTLTFDLPCSRWFCPRLWAPPTWPRGGPPWSRRTGWSSWSAFGWSGVSWSPPHSWSPPPDGRSRAPESPLQGTSPAGWPTKEQIQSSQRYYPGTTFKTWISLTDTVYQICIGEVFQAICPLIWQSKEILINFNLNCSHF